MDRSRTIDPVSFDDALERVTGISAPADDVRGQAAKAIDGASSWLLAAQDADGFWCGELEGDTILESEYVLLLAWLGRHDTPEAHKAARYILSKQLPEGGWSIYPGGKLEISASVKAYFALKLTGHAIGAEHMQRARRAILAHGGADAVNSFTRYYLALLGQISYEQCPAVPPEFLLLPNWFPVNLYSISSWSRTILVPLSILSSYRPVTSLDARLGIRELFLKSPDRWPPLRCPGLKGGTGPLSWDRFFRMVDAAWKLCQRHNVLPLRRRAIGVAARWMIDRFDGSDGLGAIFPPIVWSVVALKCLGYADDSLEVRYCHEQLRRLMIEEDDTLRLQPCKSPVWDTAIALRALLAAGNSGDSPTGETDGFVPPVRRAVEWLLDKQIRRTGDWSTTVEAEPGGWCFEHANDFYPDLDDTSMVAMALAEQFIATADGAPTGDATCTQLLSRTTKAIALAERWMLGFQNRDGGWGAFDRDNDAEFLCHVPFADHNAMIDPSTADLTARVLEALGRLGRRVGDPAVDRAVHYLRSSQEADGSWIGRWGVNYIYGTWQVLTGLAAVGVPSDDPLMVAGAEWLLAHQQAAGAWGESCDTYADPALRGQGPPTASQTAWAVLGLLAAGRHDDPATLRGIRWLVAQQREDGSWDESEFTGTGFPLVFYLRYHLYRIYFPLLALARWRKDVRLPTC
ncbi:MAG TPA: squalene--hopene cyclase [Pirellulales bacterium]|jgi:squalene-hopene/tetraprenyl-beta-curcumene cyclase|nr:squalene--hopene cyclase [Pirellulales bacterium]